MWLDRRFLGPIPTHGYLRREVNLSSILMEASRGGVWLLRSKGGRSRSVMAASSLSSKKIELKSSDGDIFVVDMAVAMESQTISYRIKMIQDESMELGNTEEAISISEVSSMMLFMVIEYCEKHLEASAAKQPLVPEEKAKLKAWDNEFVDLDLDTLYDLVLAANYLKMQGLFDLTCKKVASMINGKTPEKVREMFNIKNDLTPEEEEEVRKEYQWA